jgi:biopolymer transport protein ExbD
MARKPSLRSRSASRAVDLNLIPYLDIVINIIMFMLFTSTGLLQIGMINVNAPRYSEGEAGAGQNEDDKDTPKLNLTVGITYQGLFIAGVGGVIGGTEATGDAAAQQGPTIPLLQNDQACRESLARKVPPPVSCYDYGKLTRELIKVKNVFPNETKIIIYAQPDIPYEALVKVMDASRQDGERALFYDVILSPEIA